MYEGNQIWLKRNECEGPSRSHTELWERQRERTRLGLGQRLKDQVGGQASVAERRGKVIYFNPHI